MTDKFTHAAHSKVVARLKRANGHLRSVIEMIEQGRPCLEIAQQLHAVEKAVTNAKRLLIHDHIDHCLDDDAESHPADMTEFRKIARYL
jgi:DNA-binding FrmR family transcriptional regulator